MVSDKKTLLRNIGVIDVLKFQDKLCLIKMFVLLIFVYLFTNTEQAPVEQTGILDFEDKWNYTTQPHHSPLLDQSKNSFKLPFYTFAKDLEVEGLDKSEHYSATLSSFRESKIVGDIVRTKVSCGVCVIGVGFLQNAVQSNTPFEQIKSQFVSLCVSFKIESFDVCSGIFDIYGPEVTAAMEVASLTSTEICKLAFGESCTGPDVPSHQWEVALPEKIKSAITAPPTPKTGMPVFKVLQISDTHYDPEYVEGSISNCDEPLCCRPYSTPKADEDVIPAGRWGSYEKCDAPKKLLENMLRHIALQHPDIDYIMWTGDLPPHDIWNQTKQYNLDVIRDTVEMVFNVFPETPIFPAIGNHESSPAGNFPPPWMKDSSHSIDWLYKEIADSWARWLPASTGNTVRHGAFYSVLLRPGFRLISVNTNYCHSLSWWLFVNSTDPANELKWLVHELQEAENKNEKVHIIGHIPPGSADCMKTWSQNFYDIVNRYESTIVALFYGHSHADEFEMFYETSDYSKPTAVAYLAPSVTSYTNFNPAYRIYYVDGDHESTTREIIDHETWTFNLDQANMEDNEPSWYKLYSAKEEYQMESLRPSEWNKLIDSMANNHQLFMKFYYNYYRGSPHTPYCDTKCRVQTLCDLKTAKSHSRHQLCHEFEAASKK